jgi:hypothetical protein
MEEGSYTFRSFASKSGSDLDYHIVVTPLRDAKGTLQLIGKGEDGEYPIEIQSAVSEGAAELKVEESMIKGLILTQNQPLKITIRLRSNRRYALGAEIYEN